MPLINVMTSSTTVVQNAQGCSVHNPQATIRYKTPRISAMIPGRARAPPDPASRSIPAIMLRTPSIPRMMAIIVMPNGRERPVMFCNLTSMFDALNRFLDDTSCNGCGLLWGLRRPQEATYIHFCYRHETGRG